MKTIKIEDSVAFVTGTSRPNGIGRAIVESLIENGARKVYATARDASQLDDLVERHKGKVVAVSLDVTDLSAIESLGDKYPDVTIVVNNAGVARFTDSTGDIALVQNQIQVNYIAPFAIVKSFAPHLNKKQTAVINIASISSFINFPMSATYCASKAALHSLTQAQRRDFPESLVMGVYMGTTDTDMVKSFDIEKAQPTDVAREIVRSIRNGDEDVFPDPQSQGFYKSWRTDPKAVEEEVAHLVVPIKPQ